MLGTHGKVLNRLHERQSLTVMPQNCETLNRNHIGKTEIMEKIFVDLFTLSHNFILPQVKGN